MISETKKREIEVMLVEYKQAVEDYEKWMEEWRKRQSRFRFQRRGSRDQR